MTEIKIYERIKEAYETSTRIDNRFEKAVLGIAWDSRFEADGEQYFHFGSLLFVTPSLDPFEINFNRPSFIFPDGSEIYL